MILLRLSPIICSRDIFGLSRDLEFVSRDLEGISGGRGLIWRGDCVWWFLWFDWLKPLKNMFYFKASGPAKFYRSRSASQYSSPLRYIRYPQSSFETFACSIQTSSSGFHRARVIPLNNKLSVNSETVAVRGFLNLPEKAGNNVSMSWLVWMRMMKETTLSKLGDRGMNWSVILSRNWKCRNTITERSNEVEKVKWGHKGHFKLTLNLSIQDVLDMIGVVSGMNNERNGVCARLKIFLRTLSWTKCCSVMCDNDLLSGQSPSFQLLRLPLQ